MNTHSTSVTSNMNNRQVSKLSDSCLQHAASYLNIKALCTLSRVNKRFYALVQEPFLWQQLCETLGEWCNHHHDNNDDDERSWEHWKRAYLTFLLRYTFNPNNMSAILYLSNNNQTVHSINHSGIHDWGSVVCDSPLVAGHVYKWEIVVNKLVFESCASGFQVTPCLVVGVTEANADADYSGSGKQIVGSSFDRGYHYVPAHGSKGHMGKRNMNFARPKQLSHGDIIGVVLDMTESSLAHDLKLKRLESKYKLNICDVGFIEAIRKVSAEDANFISDHGAKLSYSFNGEQLGVAYHGITGQEFYAAISLSGSGQCVSIRPTCTAVTVPI